MWVAITIAAATFQILRTSRQHRLREVLSTYAAGFVRYAYAAPLAAIAFAAWFGLSGHPVPAASARFWVYVSVAGVAQIVATVLLLTAFKARSFAIGTVYSKAEVVAVALLGVVATGDLLSAQSWIGIAVCLAGVVILASGGHLREALTAIRDRGALYGVAAGLFFGVAAVGVRGGAQSLETGTAWERALVTLTAMLTIEAVVNGAHLAATNSREFAQVFRTWRVALPVGVFSVAGSAGWAWAMALEPAAKVRTLGQVELLIAFGVAHVTLKERHTRLEYVASACVAAGVTLVVLG